jgi:chromosome segregation ATPase
MKSETTDRVIFLVVIIVVIASLGAAFLALKEQQVSSRDEISLLKLEVNGFRSTFRVLQSKIKEINVQAKAYSENFKNIEGKISAADLERKDIAAKIDELALDVERLKGGSKASASPKAGTIELGEIPVKK